MRRKLQGLLVLLVTWAAGSGCAILAKRPPTPAADIPASAALTMTPPPGERYFLLVFGSQSTPKRAKYTHTWASVVRVTGCDTPAPHVDEHTISWMPASLDIRPLSLRVERGTNLPLHFTIEEMLRHEEHVALWGPYEVGPGFYQRFLTQKEFLESGRIGYQCIDNIGEAARCGNGCDCIHAVTDMDPMYDRRRYPLSYNGEGASRHIVREIHIRPVIICPSADHGWLLPKLGLDQYPIDRQKYTGRTVPNTPENVERFLRKSGN